MPEREYRRLTRTRSGRGPGAGGGLSLSRRASLWLGRDHLLQIDSTGYSETYKRFYFRDIQAIIIRPNGRRRLWNWILSVLTALCLAFGLGTNPELGARLIVWLILASPLVALLVVNNVFGPTCDCQVRTAVQREYLPSLSRVRRAQRVLAIVRPLIAAAQGELTREAIAAGLEQLSESRPAGVSTAIPPPLADAAASAGETPTP
ncbi:MAG TPA: hypothetical protein VFY29_15115 [Terriglobia bacterium]|nr:hypothetical protein [Terriglobia bacterium]